jgi:hypothetical protein
MITYNNDGIREYNSGVNYGVKIVGSTRIISTSYSNAQNIIFNFASGAEFAFEVTWFEFNMYNNGTQWSWWGDYGIYINTSGVPSGRFGATVRAQVGTNNGVGGFSISGNSVIWTSNTYGVSQNISSIYFIVSCSRWDKVTVSYPGMTTTTTSTSTSTTSTSTTALISPTTTTSTTRPITTTTTSTTALVLPTTTTTSTSTTRPVTTTTTSTTALVLPTTTTTSTTALVIPTTTSTTSTSTTRPVTTTTTSTTAFVPFPTTTTTSTSTSTTSTSTTRPVTTTSTSTTRPITTTTTSTSTSTTTSTTTTGCFGFNLTPVFDTTCTSSGPDVTAYKTTSGAIIVGNTLYNTCNGTTLATGFYSDGSWRYVVNVGTVTNKIACPLPTTTTTSTSTSTSTSTTSSTTSTTTTACFGYNLTPVFDNTCTASGSDITAYKNTGGSIIVGNILRNTCGGTTLATGFYSDGGFRYIVNVGEVTAKIACPLPTTTTTSTTSTSTSTTTTSTSTSTTSTTTTIAPNVNWVTNGSAGGSGKLEITRTSDGLLIFSNVSNSGLQSGVVTLSIGVQYTISGSWNSGSGNIVRVRVCDVAGQLGYSGNLTATPPSSWSINITPTSGNVYYPYLTSGSSLTPPPCI